MSNVTNAIQEAIQACRLFTDEMPETENVQNFLASYPGIEVSAERIEIVMEGQEKAKKFIGD